MSRGICTVAFGKEYDKIAAACARVTRSNTPIPIFVMTNLTKPDRSPDWDSVADVSFSRVEASVEENRRYKTSLYQYTPFQENIYIDADSVVQKRGVCKFFDLLNEPQPVDGQPVFVKPDVVLNMFKRFPKGSRTWNIYRRAMNQFGEDLPLSIYNGALVVFRKDEKAKKLFDLWRRYWEEFGRGREMPCLACAVKKLKQKGLIVRELPPNWYSPECLNDRVIIQHYSGGNFLEKFGLPAWERWTPFDTNPNDFRTEP